MNIVSTQYIHMQGKTKTGYDNYETEMKTVQYRSIGKNNYVQEKLKTQNYTSNANAKGTSMTFTALQLCSHTKINDDP